MSRKNIKNSPASRSPSDDSEGSGRSNFLGLLLGVLGLIAALLALWIRSPGSAPVRVVVCVLLALGSFIVVVREARQRKSSQWFIIGFSILFAVAAAASSTGIYQLTNHSPVTRYVKITSHSPATPYIRITSPVEGTWITQTPVIEGTVTPLAHDQEVWSFNEPFSVRSLPQQTGNAYPDAGPCEVSGTSFTCAKDFPGGPGPDYCGRFVLWVAIVTVQEGNLDNNTKDGLGQNKGQTYLTIDDRTGPPHVGNAFDRVEVQQFPKGNASCDRATLTSRSRLAGRALSIRYSRITHNPGENVRSSACG